MKTNYKNIIRTRLLAQLILGASVIPGAIAMNGDEDAIRGGGNLPIRNGETATHLQQRERQEETHLNTVPHQRINQEPEQDCGATCWDYTSSCMSGFCSFLGCCLTWYCNRVCDDYDTIKDMNPGYHYTATQPTTSHQVYNSANEYKRQEAYTRSYNEWQRTGVWNERGKY